MRDISSDNLLLNSKLDGDIQVAEFDETLFIHRPNDWEVYLDHSLAQFPKITMDEPGMLIQIDGDAWNDAWRIDLVQNDVLLEQGKYYAIEVISRLNYDDDDVDLEYSFHLIGDYYEIITPWQTPSGSTHVVIGIPDNQDNEYQFRLCIKLNGSAVRGSIKLEKVSIVEIDKDDGFDYLDEAWVEVDEDVSNHLTDSADMNSIYLSKEEHWKIGFAVPRSNNPVNIRSEPGLDSSIIGQIIKDKPIIVEWNARLIQNNWYPVRVHMLERLGFVYSGWMLSTYIAFLPIHLYKS